MFAQVLKDFSEQWTQEGVFVMDASFYTQPNLKQVGSLGWLSRVPLTLKAAQALVQSEVSLLSEVTCDSPDYRMWEVEQTDGEVAQRQISNLTDERRLIIRLFGPPLSGITTHLVNHLSTCGMEAPTLKNTLFYGSSGVSWKQVEPL